jgi:hypothetical protein
MSVDEEVVDVRFVGESQRPIVVDHATTSAEVGYEYEDSHRGWPSVARAVYAMRLAALS